MSRATKFNACWGRVSDQTTRMRQAAHSRSPPVGWRALTKAMVRPAAASPDLQVRQGRGDAPELFHVVQPAVGTDHMSNTFTLTTGKNELGVKYQPVGSRALLLRRRTS